MVRAPLHGCVMRALALIGCDILPAGRQHDHHHDHHQLPQRSSSSSSGSGNNSDSSKSIINNLLRDLPLGGCSLSPARVLCQPFDALSAEIKSLRDHFLRFGS